MIWFANPPKISARRQFVRRLMEPARLAGSVTCSAVALSLACLLPHFAVAHADAERSEDEWHVRAILRPSEKLDESALSWTVRRADTQEEIGSGAGLAVAAIAPRGTAVDVLISGGGLGRRRLWPVDGQDVEHCFDIPVVPIWSLSAVLVATEHQLADARVQVLELPRREPGDGGVVSPGELDWSGALRELKLDPAGRIVVDRLKSPHVAIRARLPSEQCAYWSGTLGRHPETIELTPAPGSDVTVKFETGPLLALLRGHCDDVVPVSAGGGTVTWRGVAPGSYSMHTHFGDGGYSIQRLRVSGNGADVVVDGKPPNATVTAQLQFAPERGWGATILLSGWLPTRAGAEELSLLGSNGWRSLRPGREGWSKLGVRLPTLVGARYELWTLWDRLVGEHDSQHLHDTRRFDCAADLDGTRLRGPVVSDRLVAERNGIERAEVVPASMLCDVPGLSASFRRSLVYANPPEATQCLPVLWRDDAILTHLISSNESGQEIVVRRLERRSATAFGPNSEAAAVGACTLTVSVEGNPVKSARIAWGLPGDSGPRFVETIKTYTLPLSLRLGSTPVVAWINVPGTSSRVIEIEPSAGPRTKIEVELMPASPLCGSVMLKEWTRARDIGATSGVYAVASWKLDTDRWVTSVPARVSASGMFWFDSVPRPARISVVDSVNEVPIAEYTVE